MWYLIVGKKKNQLFVYKWDGKIRPLQSPFVITRQAVILWTYVSIPPPHS